MYQLSLGAYPPWVELPAGQHLVSFVMTATQANEVCHPAFIRSKRLCGEVRANPLFAPVIVSVACVVGDDLVHQTHRFVYRSRRVQGRGDAVPCRIEPVLESCRFVFREQAGTPDEQELAVTTNLL